MPSDADRGGGWEGATVDRAEGPLGRRLECTFCPHTTAVDRRSTPSLGLTPARTHKRLCGHRYLLSLFAPLLPALR